MKVIDLLNKIANGERVPSEIRYNDRTYSYYGRQIGYSIKSLTTSSWNNLCNSAYNYYNLNEEIEIIEGIEELEEEKEIEKMHVFEDSQEGLIKIGNKINELIDVVNELKRGQ